MSFWDINQFLAEDQKIEYHFLEDVEGVEFLDSTKEGVISAGDLVHSPIWLVTTLYDYLESGQSQNQTIKVKIPVDFHVKSLDRIQSFRTSHRSSVENLKIKSELPYFYEMYDSMKKITQNEDTKFNAEQIGRFLEERGKMIIDRASNCVDESKTDPITNNYTKFQHQLYRQTRKKTLQYEKWKTKS